MDQNEVKKRLISSSNIDIDQLCHLIDENTFGLKTCSSSKLSSISSYQIKAFHSTRLKRLNCSLIIKSNIDEHDNCSSLLNRFRSLSTSQSRRDSTTKPILPSMNEEEMNCSTQSQSLYTRQTSCNVEELAAYFDDFLYLPKSLSGAAELMYT
jgi:hypothetical protein